MDRGRINDAFKKGVRRIAEGMGVGAVYLDLVVRDTIGAQTSALAQKAAHTLQKGFSDAGHSAGKALSDPVTKAAEGTAKRAAGALKEKISGAGKAAAGTLQKSFAGAGEQAAQAVRGALRNGCERAAQDAEAGAGSWAEKLLAPLQEFAQKRLEAFNLSNAGDDAEEIDLLQRKMENMRDAVEHLELKLTDLQMLLGAFPVDSFEGKKIAQQITSVEGSMLSLEQRTNAARDRLALLTDGRMFESWGAVFKHAAKTILSGFGQIARGAGGLALSGVKKLGGGIKALSGKLLEAAKKGAGAFASVGKSLLGTVKHTAKGTSGMQSFGARLRSIASGALIFNGLSSALRGMTSRLGEAVTGTAQMKTALARLQGAAAVAAAPLISALTPALSAIATAAATAFSYLAKLISLLTGRTVGGMQSAAKSMAGYGAAAGGAAKKINELAKANNALGLDELNTIDTSDSQNDPGGGGGGGAGEIAPDLSFEGRSPFLDSVLEAIRNGDYTQVGVLFAEKLNGIVAGIDWAPIDATLQRWANNLADGLNGFVGRLNWATLGEKLIGGLNAAMHATDAFFQRFDWQALGKGLADGLTGAVSNLDAAALGRVLTDRLRAAVEMLYGFVTTFEWGALGQKLAQMLDAAIGNIDWATAGAGISGLATGLLETIRSFLAGADWGQIGADAGAFLCNIDWTGIALELGQVVLEALGGLLELCGGFFAELAAHCGEGFFGGLLDAFADVADWLRENIVDPLVNGIKNLLGIHSPSTVFAEIGMFLVQGLWNGLSDTWGTIVDFFSEKLGAIAEKISAAWDGIRTTTRAVWSAISGFVTGVWDGIRTKCGAVWDSVKEKTLGVWTDLKTGIKSRVNDIIRVMNGLLSGAASMVNRMIDVLNGFSIDVPKWAQGVVGTDRFGFSIPQVTAPQIPMLAEGGYLGPNQPRLAIVGDNRREGEIVAPESKIAEAVAAGMAGRAGAADPELLELLAQILEGVLHIGDKDTSVLLDGEVLARSVQGWQQNRGAAVGGAFADAY